MKGIITLDALNSEPNLTSVWKTLMGKGPLDGPAQRFRDLYQLFVELGDLKPDESFGAPGYSRAGKFMLSAKLRFHSDLVRVEVDVESPHPHLTREGRLSGTIKASDATKFWTRSPIVGVVIPGGAVVPADGRGLRAAVAKFVWQAWFKRAGEDWPDQLNAIVVNGRKG